MSKLSRDQIPLLIHKFLIPKLKSCNVDPNTIQNDTDLFAAGILDSFELIELLCEIEDKTGLSANFTSKTAGGTGEVEIIPSIEKLTLAFFNQEK